MTDRANKGTFRKLFQNQKAVYSKPVPIYLEGDKEKFAVRFNRLLDNKITHVIEVFKDGYSEESGLIKIKRMSDSVNLLADIEWVADITDVFEGLFEVEEK